ncbi:MAG: hypothetical protein JJU29_09565 [Verrucomicrobia bacterium]|nr:hypothetical protein [Verrucomicrobiota bacterium]MCH8513099.1 hypothetical protein [Kiritimatiellia bacterium]
MPVKRPQIPDYEPASESVILDATPNVSADVQRAIDAGARTVIIELLHDEYSQVGYQFEHASTRPLILQGVGGWNAAPPKRFIEFNRLKS